MAIKKVLLKKSVSGSVFDIYPQTDAAIVAYGNTSVKLQLDALVSAMGSSSVADQLAALKKEILGITDGEVLDSALDTIKELAEWIKSDTSGGAQLITDVAALKTTVGDSTSGLVKRVTDLETSVDTATTGLKDRVTALETSYDAAKVTETEARKFVTTEQLGIINAAAAVNVVASMPETVVANDLYAVETADIVAGS